MLTARLHGSIAGAVLGGPSDPLAPARHVLAEPGRSGRCAVAATAVAIQRAFPAGPSPAQVVVARLAFLLVAFESVAIAVISVTLSRIRALRARGSAALSLLGEPAW